MSNQKSQKRVIFSGASFRIRMVWFAVAFALGLPGVFVLSEGQTQAATNSTINFQARLENAAGNIAPDGNYNVQFKLYNASSGGTALWTETYQNSNSQGVTVKNGYLSVNLGSITAFPGTINWDQDLWVTLNVGGNGATASWDGEMNPRLHLTSVPYAFRAGQLAQFNSGNGFTSTLNLVQPTSGNQTFQIPDQGVAGTYSVCIANSSACGFALSSGNTNYIQNQLSSAQTSSNFWIDGTGRAATSLQAPLIDAATASTALNIGTTNASVINLNQNVTVANNKTFTANGNVLLKAVTASQTAFQISNTRSTPLINVDSTTLNLVSNSSFEPNITNWANKGTATLSQTSSQAFQGFSSLQAIVSAASSGVTTSTFTSTPTASTQYEVTFMARCSASISTFTYGRQDVSGTDINATTTATCDTNWRRFTFHFTTGATITNPNIYMTLGSATSGTMWIDAVQMIQTTVSGAIPYSAGSVKIDGVINDPVVIQNVFNSTNAFEVQNTTGHSNTLVVDTVNNLVNVNALNVAGTQVITSARVLQNVTANTSILTAGTLGIARGGTGVATTPTNGQLLIGNGAGYTLGTLAAGSGVTITNAAGSITIAASGGTSGTAGGDLTGTYPNPTIASLQGGTLTITTPTGGNFLQYNGSAWVNQSVSGDISINSSGVAAIGSGVIVNGDLSTGTFSNITGTGALTAGSIASGFGIISTNNNITTSATIQGVTVNGTSALQTSGTNRIDSAGNLVNIGTITASTLNINDQINLQSSATSSQVAFNFSGKANANFNFFNGGGASGSSIALINGSTGDFSNNGVITSSGTGNSSFAGNLGIGLTTPGARLDVKGSTSDSSANTFNLQNSSGTALLTMRNDGQFTVGWTAGSGTTTTFGSTTLTSADNTDNNFFSATKYTTGSTGGSLTSISVYVGAIDPTPANDKFRVAIYADGGTNMPTNLIAQSSEGTLTPNGWNTLTVSATLAANTNYWLVYNTNGTAYNYNYFWKASGATNQYYEYTMPYGSYPATAATNGSNGATAVAIYGTYTLAGSGTVSALTVASNGNVGIGTNSTNGPNYALDVQSGDINTSGAYRINGAIVCTSSGCTPAAGSSNYIQNGTSPQSGANFNISGTGVAATFQASAFDTAAAGTLSIGTANATTLNIATNNANHTIAIGTGAAVQGITIGSTNSSSSTTIYGGTGGINLRQSSSSLTQSVAKVIQGGTGDSVLELNSTNIGKSIFLGLEKSSGGNFVVGSSAANTGTASTSYVTPAYVQSATATDASDGYEISTTFPSNTTAGNTIIVAFQFAGAEGNNINCSDTQGDVFHSAAFEYRPDANEWTGVCYASNIVGGTTTTTVSLNPLTDVPNRAIAVSEYSGLAKANPVDVTARNYGDATTATDNATSTAATTTLPNDLIFGVNANDPSVSKTVTAGTGYTLRVNNTTAVMQTEDKVLASPGSAATTFTFSAAAGYLSNMVAFKAATTTSYGTTTNTDNLANPVLKMSQSGVTTFKNVTDSTSAFQVQTSTAGAVLDVDTANARVGIGTNAPQYTLDVRSSAPSFQLASGNMQASTNIFSDNFNRANGTLGSNWTVPYGTFAVSSNQATMTGTPGTAYDQEAYVNNITPSSPDYSVSANVSVNNSSASDEYVGVVGRRTSNGTSDSNGYYAFLHYNSNGSSIELWEKMGGNWVQLSTKNYGVTTSGTYALKLSMNGDVLKVYVGGTMFINLLSDDITTTGTGGISNGSGGSANGLWDNFSIDTVPNANGMVTNLIGDKAYLQGNTNQDGSFVTYDLTNSRMGIGVLNGGPQATLDVRGSVNIQASGSSTHTLMVRGASGAAYFGVDTLDGAVQIDPQDNNYGGLWSGLTFGSSRCEGIASDRSVSNLNFFTGCNQVMSLGNDGSALFKNATNSTTAFQVQDAGSNALLLVDTTNGNVRIDAAANNAGTFNHLLVFGGTASGEGIGSDRTGSSSNPYGLDFYVQQARALQLSNSGQALFKNVSDSTSGFQIQDASGNNELKVDTANGRLTIGAAPGDGAGLDVYNSIRIWGTDTNGSHGRLYFGDNAALEGASNSDANNPWIGEGPSDSDLLEMSGSAGIWFNTGYTTDTYQYQSIYTETGHFCINNTSCTHQLGVNGSAAASGGFATGTPDIAEYITTSPDVSAYDVVAADPNNSEAVVKATKDTKQTMVGVISDGTSGFMMQNAHYGQAYDINTQAADANAKPMTLAGRIPVHVTNENGAIHPGDYLTASSTPGYAMKATEAGPTVGKALGFFDGSSGTVLALINLSYYDPFDGNHLQAQTGSFDTLTASAASFASLNVSGATTLSTLTVTGNSSFQGDLAVTGTITAGTIVVNGHIITSGQTPVITIGEASGQAAAQSSSTGPVVSIIGTDTAGTITLTTGSTNMTSGALVHLSFAQGFNSAYMVTLSANNGAASKLQYYVLNTPSGFDVVTDGQAQGSTEYRFNYMVLGTQVAP